MVLFFSVHMDTILDFVCITICLRVRVKYLCHCWTLACCLLLFIVFVDIILSSVYVISDNPSYPSMAYPPAIQGGSVPVSKIELHIKCTNLIDKDVTSKSDPCAVLYLQDKGRWYEVSTTSTINRTGILY